MPLKTKKKGERDEKEISNLFASCSGKFELRTGLRDRRTLRRLAQPSHGLAVCGGGRNSPRSSTVRKFVLVLTAALLLTGCSPLYGILAPQWGEPCSQIADLANFHSQCRNENGDLVIVK